MEIKCLTSGKLSFEKTISRHVLPHAPSPTITNFFRMAAILTTLSIDVWIRPYCGNPRNLDGYCREPNSLEYNLEHL